MLQEKFKREFKQRFQFHRSRRWTTSEATHSMDLDKTYFGTRSTYLSQQNDWRRSYTMNGYRRGHQDRDLYVFQTAGSNVVTHATQSELEELCL